MGWFRRGCVRTVGPMHAGLYGDVGMVSSRFGRSVATVVERATAVLFTGEFLTSDNSRLDGSRLSLYGNDCNKIGVRTSRWRQISVSYE